MTQLFADAGLADIIFKVSYPGDCYIKLLEVGDLVIKTLSFSIVPEMYKIKPFS